MQHRYSLSFLTTFDAPPPEAIRIAARAGYDFVGLRFLPAGATEPPHAAMTDRKVQDEIASALKETGLGLADMEIVRLKPETRISDFEPLCALGQRFGARHVVVAGDDTDRSRLTENFGRFCELAAPYELTADLEFMPWTAVKDIADAGAVLSAAAQPNAGILFDTLHFDRCGSRLDEISALPRNWVHYFQVCDGPVPYDTTTEGLIHVAREERLLPGDGGIDLLAQLERLPKDVVVSVEVPRAHLVGRISPYDRAKEALDAAKALYARLDDTGV